MFEFIKFIQKRPSDKTIIISKILLWIILIFSLYYSFFLKQTPNEIEKFIFFWMFSTNWFENIIKYTITTLWLFPILFAILNLTWVCVAKKKIIKILQIIFWILLWYSAALIVNTNELDINEVLMILWFFPFFAWLTWKCIISKCLKYGEKINKIRV